MFFYSDTGPPSKFDWSLIERLNPLTQYLTHYGNYLFLNFMLRKGTAIEVQQANKELAICEKKLNFWEKQYNFAVRKGEMEKGLLEKEREKLNKNWTM